MGRRKKKSKTKYIPESLGNSVCGVLPYVISLLLNGAIHLTIFFVYGAPLGQLWRFVLSFFFFIYPFSYVTDIQGHAVTSIEDIREKDRLFIAVTDGRIETEVIGTKKEEPWLK